MEDVRSEIIEAWLRGDWVRELGFGVNGSFYRELSLSRDDFFALVFGNDGVDSYAELFSLKQLSAGVYDAIFIDVDAHGGRLSRARNKYLELIRVLESAGYRHVDFFSGRGFHVYLYFPETEIRNYGSCVRSWAEELGIVDVIDLNAFGRTRQLVRIPFTVNTKVGMRLIPISGDESISELRKLAKVGEFNVVPEFRINVSLQSDLLKYDVDSGERDVDRNGFFGEVSDIELFPRCIQSWIKQLIVEGELDHLQRVNLAVFLLRVWGLERTKKLMSLARDYSEWKTSYQLEYLKRRGYYIMKCARIRAELGGCPYEDMHECPFFPWIEPFLPSWGEVVFDESE